jgi:hypothetical protein
LGEDAFRVMNRTLSATNLQQSHIQPLYETGAILNNRNEGLKPWRTRPRAVAARVQVRRVLGPIRA